MFRITSKLVATALPLALAACGTSAAAPTTHPAAITHAAASGNPPKVDPANFTHPVENPWFPLRPGQVARYKGENEGTPAVDVLTVTSKTKDIQGVKTTVVDDRLYLNGKLGETTEDWYAQDNKGNVWYFGEDTATLDPATGHVKSRDGSFQSGVNGAAAGIFLGGDLKVGQTGQQEYYKGHAEDHYKVVGLNEPVSVPFVSTRHALKTEETSPLEPGVLDNKFYVRGIGTVVEKTVKGGNELFKLVAFKKGKM